MDEFEDLIKGGLGFLLCLLVVWLSLKAQGQA